MADLLGQEIKARIESYLTHPELDRIVANPKALEEIDRDFKRKARALRAKLGEVYADLESFHAMVFDPNFTMSGSTRRTLAAALIYFLNPFEFFPEGIPLLGLVDGRLVIACAAQSCAADIGRYAARRRGG